MAIAIFLGGLTQPASATSPADLARLGNDLTPTGAEKAGNKEGTIPAWTGGLTKAPAGFDPAKGYADPFAGEQPLYTITATNAQQYKDKLAPGQMEMLKRYPDYKMLVYPTHRTSAFPQFIYDAAKTEGAAIKLANEGNAVQGAVKTSIPFPVPTNGAEVIWNHVFRYRGGSWIRYQTEFAVQANGSFTPTKRTEYAIFSNVMENPDPNRLFYWAGLTTGPASSAGDALIVIDPLDQVKETRLAWVYNPGTRRAMRAPELAYDAPGLSADGLRTLDDYDGFNGALDRYDWKLIGKKEMIIPYNNYKVTDKSLKYKDIARAAHLNQDLLRYELHRVWIVESTLKAGKRHIYGKRVFYIDEDSWQMAMADKYDGRGELWRMHEMLAIQFYDVPTFWVSAEVLYDLQARRYIVNSLSNEEKPYKWGVKLNKSFYSPDNMRRISN